jgi:hypothetical protein
MMAITPSLKASTRPLPIAGFPDDELRLRAPLASLARTACAAGDYPRCRDALSMHVIEPMNRTSCT